MGCLEQKAIDRQKTGEKLHYYIFDVWALNGKSLMKTKFEDRVEVLQMMEERRFTKCTTSGEESYEKFAHYYEGKELWGRLKLALANGYEGAVITRKRSTRRGITKTLKIKKELQETLDVVILDMNPPTRMYNGKEIEGWKLWENVRTGEKNEW